MLNFEKVPFQEAIDFLRQKVALPSTVWDQLWSEYSAASFTVSSIVSADLLNDLLNAIVKAETEGTDFDEFKRSTNEAIENYGIPTALTNDRLRLVFEQNLSSANGAARMAQINELKPQYLLWRHRDSRTPRPSHLALNNRVFRREDLPFYPPCGFNCRCGIFGLSARDLKERNLTVSEPIKETMKFRDRITGETHKVPAIEVDGEMHPIVEPGFHNQKGLMNADERRSVLMKGLDRLPPELREQARNVIENMRSDN